VIKVKEDYSNVVTVGDKIFVPLEEANNFISKEKQKAEDESKENSFTSVFKDNTEDCFPTIESTIKYFFTRSVLLITLIGLLLLNTPELLNVFFGIKFSLNEKLFEFIKILVTIPCVVALHQTALNYFRECVQEKIEGTINTEQLVSYTFQTWYLSIAVSTIMYIYPVNFEALGMDVFKDVLRTLNVASMLFAGTVFILWRFFTLDYRFLFSPVDFDNDEKTSIYGAWQQLSPTQRIIKSIVTLFFVLYILTTIWETVSFQ
jgi:hypothetical protein